MFPKFPTRAPVSGVRDEFVAYVSIENPAGPRWGILYIWLPKPLVRPLGIRIGIPVCKLAFPQGSRWPALGDKFVP